ncbi:MAG: hypothetical protein WCD18_26435 [Thermosynechococcaceae cyanobacterium]
MPLSAPLSNLSQSPPQGLRRVLQCDRLCPSWPRKLAKAIAIIPYRHAGDARITSTAGLFLFLLAPLMARPLGGSISHTSVTISDQVVPVQL